MAKPHNPKPKGRVRVSLDEVKQSIEEIREYHAIGAKSRERRPGRAKHGKFEVDEEAKGWSVTKFLKARQFAAAYSADDLDDLCEHVRKHLPQFGTAHVGILVTIPDAKVRKKLQIRCIEKNLSKAQLIALVKRHFFGPRSSGGRHRRVPRDPGLLLTELRLMSESWCRWMAIAKPGTVDEAALPRIAEEIGEIRRRWSRLVKRRPDTDRPAILDKLPPEIAEAAEVIELVAAYVRQAIDALRKPKRPTKSNDTD